MADAISIQELIDARTDAKTLEEAVNGDAVTTVLSRLGETYPTLSNALNQIDSKLDSADAQIKQGITNLFENGGLPATPFKTHALMTASSLPNDSYAIVTNDADDAKNIVYVKTAGTWAASRYAPVTQSQLADELNARAELTDSDLLFELQDSTGNHTAVMRNDGSLYLTGLNESVQQSVETIASNINDVESRNYYTLSGTILTVNDANDDAVAAITDSGSLVINDVITEGGSVERRLHELGSSNATDTKTQVLKIADRTVAGRDESPHKVQTSIANRTPLGIQQIQTPVLTRIEKNKFMLTFSGGRAGDFGEGDANIGGVHKCDITVNPDKSLTVGEITLPVSGGVDDEGEYGAGGATNVLLNLGDNAGRIYMYYTKRYGAEKDYFCSVHSDDLGATWSTPRELTEFIPNAVEWRITTAGPAKAIQIQSGEHKGRIVIPCWHGDQNYPGSQRGLRSFIFYSDDGGLTYQVGAESNNMGSNECAVAEFDDGKLMLLTRNASDMKVTEISLDGGETLTDMRVLDEVKTTKVQSGFVQAQNRFDLAMPKMIISTPSGVLRNDLGLYISYDNVNFDTFAQIQTGDAAYSDVDIIDESHILVVYVGSYYKTLDAVVVNLKSILLGE